MSKHTEVPPNRTLTEDAAAALGRAGFSRRSFLMGPGALSVSFSMNGGLQTATGQGLFEGGTAGSPPLNHLHSGNPAAADERRPPLTPQPKTTPTNSTAPI